MVQTINIVMRILPQLKQKKEEEEEELLVNSFKAFWRKKTEERAQNQISKMSLAPPKRLETVL